MLVTDAICEQGFGNRSRKRNCWNPGRSLKFPSISGVLRWSSIGAPHPSCRLIVEFAAIRPKSEYRTSRSVATTRSAWPRIRCIFPTNILPRSCFQLSTGLNSGEVTYFISQSSFVVGVMAVGRERNQRLSASLKSAREDVPVWLIWKADPVRQMVLSDKLILFGKIVTSDR